MIHPALQTLDLNLLVALDVLLTERSVTRSAEQSGVSQPAMSQALARLRQTFDDPLLVRVGHRMEPTALAESLSVPLHTLLSNLESLINDRGTFEPATSSRTFRIACLDHFSAIHLPAIAAAIRAEAPNVDIVATQLSYRTLDSELEQGLVDVAVGAFRRTPAGSRHQRLHDEHFLCLLRSDHPALDNWTIETFLAHPHGLLTTAGRGGGAVDATLERAGMSRRIAVRVPHFLAAGQLVETTDLIFTMASRLAQSLAQRHEVVTIEPPLDLPTYAITLQWHRRTDGDLAHRWFRQHVIEASQDLQNLPQ